MGEEKIIESFYQEFPAPEKEAEPWYKAWNVLEEVKHIGPSNRIKIEEPTKRELSDYNKRLKSRVSSMRPLIRRKANLTIDKWKYTGERNIDGKIKYAWVSSIDTFVAESMSIYFTSTGVEEEAILVMFGSEKDFYRHGKGGLAFYLNDYLASKEGLFRGEGGQINMILYSSNPKYNPNIQPSFIIRDFVFKVSIAHGQDVQ